MAAREISLQRNQRRLRSIIPELKLFAYPLGVDWRRSLRKLVNREDYLGGWRLALMRIIDPVEWYMRKHDEENVRPAYRRRRGAAAGWTRYASIDEGASDPELHRRLTEEASRREDAYRQAREVLRRDYTSFFEAKARELLDRHEVTIRGANGKVQARLVRFRNGMVFEHTETSPGSTGGGMTRIERTQLPQASRILAVYLENAVLGLGVAPGPLE